jgi:hypothetical protein
VKIRIRITAAVLLALLLAGAGLGVWYLRLDRFQEYARGLLIARIEKASGMICRIERFRLSVFRGRISISGLTLAPRDEAPGLATLNIPEIRAAISISSFWHFRIRLADLEIIKPQVKIISGGGGTSWNPEGALNALKVSLRLEASRVVVANGLFTVNSRTSPFSLSLNKLDCEIRYSKQIPSYKIRVEYEKSRIFYPPRDVVHDLEVEADLSLQGIDIEFFRLRYHSSLLTGSGSMKDWNSPVWRIHAGGLYDVRDLTLAHASIDEGHGMMGIVADLRIDGNGVYSKGNFSVRNGKYRKMAFHDLAGQFEIKNEVLYLAKVSGGIAQGNVLVDGVIQLASANSKFNRISILSKSVPLIEVGRVLNLPLMTFENAADTTTIITWQEGDEDLKVDCNVNLQGIEPPATMSGNSTPFAGNIRFIYSGTGDVYVISGNLNSANSSMQATGEPGGSFRVAVSTNRIAEPFSFIAQMSQPVVDLLTRQPDVLSMAGSFRFNGSVRISSSEDVEYRGDLSIRNGRWRNYKLDTLTAQADFLPPRLHLRSMVIHGGPQSVNGNMDLELAEEEIKGFDFQGNIHQLSIPSLKDFGADTEDASGILSGSGSIKYGNNNWEGEGNFSIEKGSFKGESFDSLNTNVQLKDRRLRVLSAEARRGAARLNASGQANLETGLLDVAVRLKGFPIDEIPALQEKHLPIHGNIGASGDFSGTIENPAFSGSLELDDLQYDSWNLGSGRGQIRFEGGVAQGNIRIQSNYGNLTAQARVTTQPGNPGSVLLEFDSLDVQKIASATIPPILKEVSTALNGKVEITGKFDNPASLNVRGEVDGAHFKIQDYEFHNANRIQFTVINRIFRFESVRFVGEGTSLVLNGNIPLEDTPQLDLNLNGSLNLKILDGIEKKLHIGGSAALNIRASGSKRDPQVIGRASFQDARLDPLDLPFRFSAMQGDIVFSRNLVRFENVRGNAASGTMQLSGIIEHQNAVIRTMNMNISVRNARMLFPKDFRSIINADLILNGNSDVQILKGDVNVIRAEYVRSFNLLEQLSGGGAIQSGPLTTEPYLMGLRLDNIEIHSDNGLLIDNELARLRGSFRLTLRGTPAYPSLAGRVEASEGNIYFRGSRFEISHASADFVDRNKINPVLEIRAEADVKTYRLILDAVGDMDHLNINIASDPPMSTVDILSLLTTGKTDTGITTTQRKSEMTGVSAASVLSENLTGVLGKRVQRIFGLESFRVDPFLAGAENDPTARITISERLSKDLVVTFSRNLTTNQEQIVVIEYDVTKNLSVVATRDEDGKYGLDFRFRKRLR